MRGYIAESREAAKARGKFGREEQKLFKGEPYERSMMYLYYGLLWYMEGEHDNARACFRRCRRPPRRWGCRLAPCAGG